MKPGVYSDISNADYHGGPGISNSGLALVRKSPMHLRVKQVAANDNAPKKTSAAFAIGTAFHALLLEPQVFAQEYCLALRHSDVPDAIEGRDQLVAMAEQINAEREQVLAGMVNGVDELRAMIAAMNAGRLPKLATTGSKDELVARIRSAWLEHPNFMPLADNIDDAKTADLKQLIADANTHRPGLLPTSGSEADLCATLRAAGHAPFLTRKEAMAKWQEQRGTPMLVDTKGSMQDIAAALRADGQPVKLWADVKAEWLVNNGHRNVLEQEQFDQLHSMRAAVMAHPAASRLMSRAGKAEQSVYWIDAATGELCRCRPDFWTDDGIIVDVKTTEDASPEGFARSIANYSYDVQDAFYQDGVAAAGRPVRAFLFLAVQKDACVVDGHSYGVAVYQMDEASRELGRAKYRQDLTVYAQCRKTNIWPNYGDKIESISLPQWQFNKSAHLLESVG